jgi:hypothetical protein
MRLLVDNLIYEDAQARESDGKPVSRLVLETLAWVSSRSHLLVLSCEYLVSEQEVHAMRLGPGKHLQGRKLFNGAVTPEEVLRSLLLVDSFYNWVNYLASLTTFMNSLSPKNSCV